MRTFRRILVPVDGSSTSNKALTHALQIARDGDGRVRLVHAIDELAFVGGVEFSGNLIARAREGAREVLAAASAVCASAGVPCDSRLVDQPAQRLGETVAAEARGWEADLIVAGTHGRRGIERVLLGSGAEQIIRQAPVPVLVIRSDDH